MKQKMRKFLIIFLVGGIFVVNCFAQTKKKSKAKTKPIRVTVTVKATDNGGVAIPPEKLPKETDENLWHEFTNEKFNFGINFPSLLKDIFEDEGEKKQFDFAAQTEKANYHVLAQQLNFGNLTNQQLDALLEDVLRTVQDPKMTRIISKKNVFLNGKLGKEIISEDKNKYHPTKHNINFMRFYLLPGKQFTLSVAIPKEKYTSAFDEWAMKFLDSFWVKTKEPTIGKIFKQ